MASLLNSRKLNRKERPNRFTNKRDMAERTIRYVVREGFSERVSDTLVKDKMSF